MYVLKECVWRYFGSFIRFPNLIKLYVDYITLFNGSLVVFAYKVTLPLYMIKL